MLTSEKRQEVRKIIFEKAKAFGYGSCARNDSGSFMDELVEDNEVGGLLKDYMTKEKIRTYIKDTVLNAYTKELVKNALESVSPCETIHQIYNVKSEIFQESNGKEAGVSVLRSNDGRLFVISCGTTLKWETALRKALELIARQPNLIINGTTPSICLHLALGNMDITDSEKKHITTALASISVKARFCEG